MYKILNDRAAVPPASVDFQTSPRYQRQPTEDCNCQICYRAVSSVIQHKDGKGLDSLVVKTGSSETETKAKTSSVKTKTETKTDIFKTKTKTGSAETKTKTKTK